jgi:hypothetical protein
MNAKANIIFDAAFHVSLNPLGIVAVCFNKDILEITKEHILSLRARLKELGAGKKLPLFVYSNEFLPINQEARDYIATAESSDYTLANAINIDTLAKKIVFNFLLRFSHPIVPTKAFSSKDEAFAWLLGIVAQNTASK